MTDTGTHHDNPTGSSMLHMLLRLSKLEASVEICSGQFPVTQLTGVKAGDSLEFTSTEDGPDAVLIVNEVPIADVELVDLDGELGLKIVRLHRESDKR